MILSQIQSIFILSVIFSIIFSLIQMLIEIVIKFCECLKVKFYYFLIIIDFVGRNVIIEKELKRIVLFVLSIIEIFYFFGVFDRVIGVIKFDDYFFGVQEGRKIIGGFSDLNIEVIVFFEFDLIIGILMYLQYFDQFEKIVLVIIFDFKNMDEVYEVVEFFGKVFNQSERVEGVVEFMKVEVVDVQFCVLNKMRLKVFFISWWNLFYVLGNGIFQDLFIEFVGGENVFYDVISWVQVSFEEVVVRNLEIIILLVYVGVIIDDICNSLFVDIDVVKNGRIYFVSDDNVILRLGLRFVEVFEEFFYFIYLEVYGYNFQFVICFVEG